MSTRMINVFGLAGFFALSNVAGIGCTAQPPDSTEHDPAVFTIPELPVTIENSCTTMTIDDLSIDGGDNWKLGVPAGKSLAVKIDYDVVVRQLDSAKSCDLAYNEQIWVGMGSNYPLACIYDGFWGEGTGGKVISIATPLPAPSTPGIHEIRFYRTEGDACDPRLWTSGEGPDAAGSIGVIEVQ